MSFHLSSTCFTIVDVSQQNRKWEGHFPGVTHLHVTIEKPLRRILVTNCPHVALRETKLHLCRRLEPFFPDRPWIYSITTITYYETRVKSFSNLLTCPYSQKSSSVNPTQPKGHVPGLFLRTRTAGEMTPFIVKFRWWVATVSTKNYLELSTAESLHSSNSLLGQKEQNNERVRIISILYHPWLSYL